jgi:hypothetical protein
MERASEERALSAEMDPAVIRALNCCARVYDNFVLDSDDILASFSRRTGSASFVRPESKRVESTKLGQLAVRRATCLVLPWRIKTGVEQKKLL